MFLKLGGFSGNCGQGAGRWRRRGAWLALVCAAAFCRPAAAAEDQSRKSALIELDGRGSCDPDGDRLQYRWRQVAGPQAALSDAAAAKPYFRAVQPGKYIFELVVSDGKAESAPARVEIAVERENLRPEALVKSDLESELGTPVVLDGSASRDADGDRLSYRWRQTAGQPLYLGGEAATQAKLTLNPANTGVYELELTVSDGKTESVPAKVRLAVSPRNRAPVARAAAAARVELPRPVEQLQPDFDKDRPTAYIADPDLAQTGENFFLDGRDSSSPTKKPLRYYWRQTAGPFIRSFDRNNEALLGFVPPEEGEYAFELVVNDGVADSLPAVRTVKAVNLNEAPVAVLEAPEIAAVGALVKLDGSRSFDREGAALAYRWRQVSGPRVLNYTLDKDRGETAPSFVPAEEGRYVFELVVNDGRRDSAAATTTVTVGRPAAAPAAHVAGNITVRPGETAILQAGGNQPGARLDYEWIQTGGPRILDGAARQQSLSLTPTQPGVYTFQLVASNGAARSAPTVCTMTVIGPAEPEPCAAPILTAAETEEMPAPPIPCAVGDKSLSPAADAATETASAQPAPKNFFQRLVKPFKRKADAPCDADLAASAGPELE